MAIVRNDNDVKYFGLDSTVLSDSDIKTAQGGGITVGAKLKNGKDAEGVTSGTPLFVVDAFDVDWSGYKVNGNSIKYTGQLILAINNALAGGVASANTAYTNGNGISVVDTPSTETEARKITVSANLKLKYVPTVAAVEASEGVEALEAVPAYIDLVDASDETKSFGSILISDIIGNSLLLETSYDDSTDKLTLKFKKADGTTNDVVVDLSKLIDINDILIKSGSDNYLGVEAASESSKALLEIKTCAIADATDSKTGLVDAKDAKDEIDAAVSDAEDYTDTLIQTLNADFTGDNAVTGTNVTLSLKEENGIITTVGVSENYASVVYTPGAAASGTPGEEGYKEATEATIVIADSKKAGLITGSDLSSAIQYTEEKIENAVGDLNVAGEDSIGASKTISAWSETDGKISITTQDIQIAESLVTNLTTDLAGKQAKIVISGIVKAAGDGTVSAAVAGTDYLAPVTEVSDPDSLDAGSLIVVTSVTLATSGLITVTRDKILEASTSLLGVVQLSSATDSDSETLAATAKAVKAAYDLADSKLSEVTEDNHYAPAAKTDNSNVTTTLASSIPDQTVSVSYGSSYVMTGILTDTKGHFLGLSGAKLPSIMTCEAYTSGPASTTVYVDADIDAIVNPTD